MQEQLNSIETKIMDLHILVNAFMVKQESRNKARNSPARPPVDIKFTRYGLRWLRYNSPLADNGSPRCVA